jgi:hypothetical protein
MVRHASNATQLCGSAIVSVRTGGKKRKMKQNTASNDAVVASPIPEAAAISKISDETTQTRRSPGVRGRMDIHDGNKRGRNTRAGEATHPERRLQIQKEPS